MRHFYENHVIWEGGLLGAVYGVLASLKDSIAATTPWSVVLTMAVGAALFACVASALCRCYRIWSAMSDPPHDILHDL